MPLPPRTCRERFGIVGWLYGAVAIALGGVFVFCALRVWLESGERAAKRLFAFSILYLFLLFAMMLVDGIALGGITI